MRGENLRNQRVMVLAAYPTRPSELRTVFSPDASSIRCRLEKPPTFRQHGFSLETWDSATIVKGEYIRVASSRKLIELYRDGTMIFLAAATGDFLGWGATDLTLNPIALVEAITSFAFFYEFVLDDFSERPPHAIFRAELHHMHLNEEKTTLVSGWSGGFILEHDRREAPEDHWEKTIQVPTENYNPREVAARIVREIYLWFGHEESAIPYVSEKDGILRVDVEKFGS